MPRFVILRHEHPRGLHWDLMLEAGDVLKTWALAEPPAAKQAVAAEALADHRRHYLDYEGPVSGDRGAVSRYDAGEYETLSQDGRRWVVRLAGKRIRGVMQIATQGDRWEVCWEAKS